MDFIKNDMSKIDKKDSMNILIFMKDIFSSLTKKLQKGIVVSNEDTLKLVMKNIKSKKYVFTNKTKDYIINSCEEKIKNPVIIDKKSKKYISALKNIQAKFSNIKKNDIKIKISNMKDENHLMNLTKKIIDTLKKTKLNKEIQDKLIIDFFISKGFTEAEVKLVIYESVTKSLEQIIKFMEIMLKYQKK